MSSSSLKNKSATVSAYLGLHHLEVVHEHTHIAEQQRAETTTQVRVIMGYSCTRLYVHEV